MSKYKKLTITLLFGALTLLNIVSYSVVEKQQKQIDELNSRQESIYKIIMLQNKINQLKEQKKEQDYLSKLG
jgi:predicted ABC-type exoprotein transport system permease subunit